MPCAGASPRHARQPFHWQCQSQHLRPLRLLLGCRLPHRHSRVERPTLLLLLNTEGDSCARNSSRVRDGARLTLMIWSVLLGLGIPLSAANVDETKLPPAAKERIDFSRDIKPMLES